MTDYNGSWQDAILAWGKALGIDTNGDWATTLEQLFAGAPIGAAALADLKARPADGVFVVDPNGTYKTVQAAIDAAVAAGATLAVAPTYECLVTCDVGNMGPDGSITINGVTIAESATYSYDTFTTADLVLWVELDCENVTAEAQADGVTVKLSSSAELVVTATDGSGFIIGDVAAVGAVAERIYDVFDMGAADSDSYTPNPAVRVTRLVDHVDGGETWGPISDRWTPIANKISNWVRTDVGPGGLQSRFAYVCTHACSRVRVEYGGNSPISDTATGAGSIANDWTLEKAALEYKGAIYPLYFDGARSVTIRHDSSERRVAEVAVNIPAGDTYYIRQRCTCAVGEAIGCQAWNTATDATLMDRYASYSTDMVDNAAVDTAWGNQLAFGEPGPRVVLGKYIANEGPRVLVIGDSLSGVVAADDNGFAQNWLSKALSAANIPFMVCSRAGERASLAYDANLDLQADLAYADIVICALGRNDALTTVDAWYQSIVDFANKLPRHLRLYGITITPSTTAANDGPSSGATVLSDASLKDLNARLRTFAAAPDGSTPPYKFIVDWADVAMSSHDSCRWASTDGTAWSTDGLHWSATVGLTGMQTGCVKFAAACK